MANCAIFFKNIDQSIDLFLKSSHLIDNDQMLKIFMNLVYLIDNTNITDNYVTDLAILQKKNYRKSINIIRSELNQYNSGSILEKNKDAEIFEKLNKQNAFLQFEKENEILLKFYIKVIHYYDFNCNLEASIELIQNALLMFQFDLQSRSTLYVILFRSYMSLEYYNKAHQTIVLNTDLEWKQNCLKTFISELCNQNKTDKLVNFEYYDMLQDVITILYEKAKSCDLRTHDYYHLVFALHVKQKDFVKAAFCMFECASRLRRELNGINSLKRQEKCYLTCLNAIKLVEKKYSWIYSRSQNDKQNKNMGNSKNYDLNLDFKIIDLNEINKSYILCHYAVKLASIAQNQVNLASHYSMEEIVRILYKFGLFDDAIVASNLLIVSDSLIQSLSYIFLNLVDRYLKCFQINNLYIYILAFKNKRCCFHDKKHKQLFCDFEVDFLKNNNAIPMSFTPYEK